MNKILHFVVDDKFIDTAIREFEAIAPGVNEFVILDAKPPFRYIKDARVRTVSAEGFAREAAREDVRGVIFHALQANHLGVLQGIPAGRTVVWVGWGYDYYGLLNDAFPDGLLQPQTARLVARLSAAPHGAVEPTQLAYARPYRKPTAREIEAMRRVDVFATLCDTEYELIRRHHPWFSERFVRWNYGTAEDDLSLADGTPRTPGPNLLLGNSATATNNHLEMFELVRRHVDLQGRQVIVPLSYGDANYRRVILQAGEQMLGAAFVPLVDYMSRDRYIEILSSCGFALMNHVRQQAVGNINISALLGARIFLNRRNPLHRWLGALGMPLGDIERLDLQPLSNAERDAQMTLISQDMSRTAQRERTRQLLDVALGGA